MNKRFFSMATMAMLGMFIGACGARGDTTPGDGESDAANAGNGASAKAGLGDNTPSGGDADAGSDMDAGGDTGTGPVNAPPPPYTEEEMMSFVPSHEEHFAAWTWDTPQRWIEIRKSSNGGVFTQEEMHILCEASPVVSINNEEQNKLFKAQYPDVLYRTGYMNLEKDTRSCDFSGNYLENPQHYLYDSNGDVYDGSDSTCPWFNLANPETREYWIGEAAGQIAGNEYTGRFFFIDALAKLSVVDGSDLVDYWGNPVGEGYWAHAETLLADFRDQYADKVLIAGNFARPRTNRNQYTLDYTHIAYIEHFEHLGNYVEHAHAAIALMQELTAAGKRLFITVNAYKKPTPVAEPTLEEMRAKAEAAMPEIWASYTETERDELAELYAYFPFKMALFLMGAGEKSHLRYVGEFAVRAAGRELFKSVMPFPEWDMALGEPLEPPQRDGDVYTRRFEHVEVVLDLANGTSEFIPR